jgi:hypothetical protein
MAANQWWTEAVTLLEADGAASPNLQCSSNLTDVSDVQFAEH